MEILQEYIRIAHLICKEKLTTLSLAERKELQQWKAFSKRNREDYEHLNHISLDVFLDSYEQCRPEKKWIDFQKRIKRSHRIRIWRACRVAASFLLLSGIAIWFVDRSSQTPVPLQPERIPTAHEIRLVLSTGETLNLSSLCGEQMHLLGGKAVANTRKLEYIQDTLCQKVLEWNTLSVPRGAFYHLILSDGTRVWLNAETEIRYPVQFTGEQREVNLSGEAFFEVAKDTACPFIVRTTNFDVKVWGTAFNINTYGDDGKAYAALQEGIIEVSESRYNSLILAPGEVAEMDMNMPGPSLKLSDMPLERQLAWKEGFFCFRHTSLREILKQVERYYDVRFIHAEYIKGEYYTGDISRNVTLDALLSAIWAQTTAYEFQTVDRTVYMIKKRD